MVVYIVLTVYINFNATVRHKSYLFRTYGSVVGKTESKSPFRSSNISNNESILYDMAGPAYNQ